MSNRINYPSCALIAALYPSGLSERFRDIAEEFNGTRSHRLEESCYDGNGAASRGGGLKISLVY